jgi:hypothetical protein
MRLPEFSFHHHPQEEPMTLTVHGKPMIAPLVLGSALATVCCRPALADEPCTKLTTESLAVPGLVIEGATMQAAGQALPKHTS